MAPRKAFGLLCCCCLLFFFFPYTTTAQNSSSDFVATDKLLINCGASGSAADGGNRVWQGDISPKLLLSSPSNSSVAPASNQEPSVPTIPCMTARIFTGPVTYSIPVGTQRKFVRLYFYPSDYGGRDRKAAVFDVTAVFDANSRGYTLLRNFTPAWNAEALTMSYLVKEYSLNVSESGFVNLTFTPSTRYPGSYAFVNGIEVVSMPDNIFNTASLALISNPSVTYDLNRSTAMEKMYRLNVGGQAVNPTSDTGLFRQWDDDSPYILGAAFGLPHSKDDNITLTYPSSTPKYSAPAQVYSTQRSLTGDVSINRQSQLSWLFSVDPGFYYLLRLYFCEIQSLYNKPNERVFNIKVNNITAESQFDVFAWATLLVNNVQQGAGLGVPFYKDYALFLPNDIQQVDLRLDLQPNDDTKPEFVDAVLNGLEIFKLNNISDFNLAGIRPSAPNFTANADAVLGKRSKGGSSSSNTGAIAGGVVGGVVGVSVLLLLLYFVFYKRRRQTAVAQPVPGPKWGKESSTLLPYSSTPSYYSGRSSLPSNLCRHFTLAEIEEATEGFDDKLILGLGGFGKVYRGVIRSDDSMAAAMGKSPPTPAVTVTKMQVAIKRANPMSEQGIREFLNEIEMLSKLRHRHLVSLIGFCDEQGEMILVYDYMANGTLREHLYSKSGKPTIGWRQRLDICIGAARGLHYLHTGARLTIIHRDVKTTNILLDDSWVAKVSDFGLSKMGPEMDQQNTHVSTVVKGSFGYLDPEYFRRQQLTEKSDVYSFGVVLFEVLCSRPALDSKLPKEQVSLAEWARYCYKKGVLEDIMDPRLRGEIAPKCLAKFAETAEKCIADRGTERPSMGDVLWSLEFALQQQEAAEADEGFQGLGGGDVFSLLATPDYDKMKDTTTTTASSTTTNSVSLASIDSDGLTPSTVFSQIMDPKGR